MRRASISAGLALAVCISVTGLAATSFAASEQTATEHTARGTVKKKVTAHPTKPTWDQCFDMSVNKGFNHDSEEWHQSIIDCMDGKIPL